MFYFLDDMDREDKRNRTYQLKKCRLLGACLMTILQALFFLFGINPTLFITRIHKLFCCKIAKNLCVILKRYLETSF